MRSRLKPMLILSFALCACSEGKSPFEGKNAALTAEPKAAAEQAAPLAGAARYAFSQGDSNLAFVGAKVTRSHDGSFGTFQGSIEIPEGKVERGVVRVDVDTGSVTTDEGKLTEHLKTAGDLLDVGAFPKARFVSTSIAPASPAGTYQVTGDLELHGIKKSIQFPAKIEVTGESVHADAEFTLDRKVFGVVYPGMPDDLINDAVLIKLKIRAKKS
jgi:polyisoprenoid-binding protein YceI